MHWHRKHKHEHDDGPQVWTADDLKKIAEADEPSLPAGPVFHPISALHITRIQDPPTPPQIYWNDGVNPPRPFPFADEDKTA